MQINTLSTERLKFRELTSTDTEKLFEIYSDKEAMKFRGSGPILVIEDATQFIKNQKLQEENILTIRKGIIWKPKDELIGSIMYKFDSHKKQECEIGYSINRTFWGRGIGKEAVDAQIKTLQNLSPITSLIAWSQKANIGSIRILEHHHFEQIEHKASPNLVLFKKVLKNS